LAAAKTGKSEILIRCHGGIMSVAQNPLIAFALAVKPEVDDITGDLEAGIPVGAADVQADIARSGGKADLTIGVRDSDGVPVGAADHEADKRASGA
jgi:hypothetical protein